jgi:hypothetical protein
MRSLFNRTTIPFFSSNLAEPAFSHMLWQRPVLHVAAGSWSWANGLPVNANLAVPGSCIEIRQLSSQRQRLRLAS